MPRNPSSDPPFFLLPDEKIVFKANPHWLFLMILLLIAGLFFMLYVFIVCPFLGNLLDNLRSVCYDVSLSLFFFLFVVIFLEWKFNRLYLTNLRLIKERGIIGKRFMTIRLEEIQDVGCAFGFWGWLFNFGDLTIESAGTEGKMTFEGLPAPVRIKEMIQKEIENRRKWSFPF